MREALKLALEALDYIRNCETDVVSQTKYSQAAEAIKEALAQPALASEQDLWAGATIDERWYITRQPKQEHVYHLRQYGDVTKAEFDRYLATGDINTTPPQPEQGVVGWQFYEGGIWHNGSEKNNHRANTEAAGIPTRSIYATPPQPEQEPTRSQKMRDAGITRRPKGWDKEQEQEPVAWLSKGGKGIWFHEPDASLSATPLYTTPPQRKPFNHHEFGYWWFEYGSGLHPLEGEDQEQHAYRVASAAWMAAHGIKE